jgi:hypothetical protein
MELQKPERKSPPLTLQQGQNILSRVARNVGRVYGVGLSVGQQSNGLMFVDDLGNAVVDDFAADGPLVIPCASEEELQNGEFLKFFGGRSMYAALTLKIAEIMESESAP